MDKSKLFYIIYRNTKRKYPDWLSEDIRNATVALLAKRYK